MTMEGAMEGARRRWKARDDDGWREATMDGARRWPSADEGCVFRRSPAPQCVVARPYHMIPRPRSARRSKTRFAWIGRSVPPDEKTSSHPQLVPETFTNLCRVTTDGWHNATRVHDRTSFPPLRRSSLASLRAPVDAVASSPLVASSPRRVDARAPAPRPDENRDRDPRARPRPRPTRPPRSPSHTSAPTSRPCPPRRCLRGMPLADQLSMPQKFRRPHRARAAGVAVDVLRRTRPHASMPPILTVDDFRTHDE